MALTNFAQVQMWFNQFITNNGIAIGPPHQDFWKILATMHSSTDPSQVLLIPPNNHPTMRFRS